MYDKATEYICFKRNLGYVYRTEAWMLQSFGRYADTIAKGKPLSVKLALQWACIPNGTKSYHAKRLDVLRPFAKFLIVNDARTELIPTGILGPSCSRTTPYIFSNEEIQQLMTVNAFTRSCKLNNFTIQTFLGLLASCGLRVGEALSLQRKDINWQDKTITVRWSKKLPMRLVPISNSVIEALNRYDQCRTSVFSKSEDSIFFYYFKEKASPYAQVKYAWQRLLKKTGIGKGHKSPPRMYDLRHTFACNCLLQAYKSKKDIDAIVHTLSVYLGHATVKETYWYLSGIPELMAICSNRVEQTII